MKKRVLCYGDSLTWGFYPITGCRIEERWTQIASEILGEEYTIIEEGLNGRTTCIDKEWSDYRNGIKSLPYILISQKPIDLLVIFLGTNDYSLMGSLERSVNVMDKFLHNAYNADTVYQRNNVNSPIYRNKPEILMIIPGPMKNVDLPEDRQMEDNDVKISYEIQDAYETLAKKYGIHYMFAKDYATASDEDGVHYLPEEHRKLGEAVARKVKEILG